MIYQTRKTAFDHISKYREESPKYDVQQSILLNWVFEVFLNVVKHRLECWIYHSIETTTKEKN